MNSDGAKVLLVDDETGILDTLRILFRGEGYEVFTALGGEEALGILSSEKPDLVVTDIRMPGTSGLEVLARSKETDPEIPVILMTAQASLQSAVRAVNEGAYYYIQKPFANDELLAICQRARGNPGAEGRESSTEEGNSASGRGIEGPTCWEEPNVPGSPRTGRDRGSHGFHDSPQRGEWHGEGGRRQVCSPTLGRAEGPFFSINCGALPESLLESELFGHVKGSFTGAVKDKEGLLVAAEGGTFFLDEIGEMSPATQVKLLRALQEREVIPVGSTEAIAVDVRIIAATNRDLEEEIRLGLSAATSTTV